jgi:two-component system CheB/CheR fusion protein
MWTSTAKACRLRQRIPEPQWQLTVADTGPGIPQLLLDKLIAHEMKDTLDMRVIHNRESDGSVLNAGEGIGLFIVKRLCAMLQAKMYIYSDASTGTTFRIIFPISL